MLYTCQSYKKTFFLFYFFFFMTCTCMQINCHTITKQYDNAGGENLMRKNKTLSLTALVSSWLWNKVQVIATYKQSSSVVVTTIQYKDVILIVAEINLFGFLPQMTDELALIITKTCYFFSPLAKALIITKPCYFFFPLAKIISEHSICTCPLGQGS